MTSPSSGTFSTDSAFQAQAGPALRMHADGIISDMNKLRGNSEGLQAGFAGASYVATMSAHEALYQDVQSQCVILAQIGDHYTKASNAQAAVTQDGAARVQRATAGAGTSSVGSINV